MAYRGGMSLGSRDLISEIAVEGEGRTDSLGGKEDCT